MKIVRVINLSNNSITIAEEVILAKKIRDFEEAKLTEEDFGVISAYSNCGVVKAFRYEKPDIPKRSSRKNQDKEEE